MFSKILSSGNGMVLVLRKLTISQTSPDIYVSPVRVFWKHRGKRRNCPLTATYPFPTVFCTFFGDLFDIFIKLKIVVCKLFQFERDQSQLFGKWLNPHQTLTNFNHHFRSGIFGKKKWANEKILVTSIFLFSHNVFLFFHRTFFYTTCWSSSANASNLSRSNILSFCKELMC